MSLILLYLVTGLLAGLLAGLFGIGGGLIIVPLLLISFRIQGLPEAVSTHLAIGTSLASTRCASVRIPCSSTAKPSRANNRASSGVSTGNLRAPL